MPVCPIDEARRSGRSQPTVLIVDDEPAIAKTLSLILQRAGNETRTASSGDEAVELAKTSSPDTLVCDIVLPGSNGIEVARTIRGLHPECQIILITGNPASADLLENARSGEFELLAKPFHPDALIQKLRGKTVADNSREKTAA